MTINICIPGISGKMGIEIAKLILLEKPNLNLLSGVVREKNKDNNKLSFLHDEIITTNLDQAISKCDVCIDFTRPDYSILVMQACVKYNKKLVIGTTGYNNAQIKAIELASKDISILKASNMSIGINLCLKLVEKISSIIGDNSDIDIIEYHHKHKVDMPSGTSLSLESAIKKKLNSSKDIKHHCLRVGNVVGDHMVKFTLENESIEVTHKSFDRKIFAEGAILSLKWIIDKDKGLYGMNDVLSL